jgi:two-component system, sensor histidine kinase SagS
VAEKPRLLVIEREGQSGNQAREQLLEHYDVVVARSMTRALFLLRQGGFAGVYVDSSQLSVVRWAGVLFQADEILEAIADGAAVVDPDLKIIWMNPEFERLADPNVSPVGNRFYQALGSPEIIGPDPCPFTSAIASGEPASTVVRISANRYLRVTVTPVYDQNQKLTHLIALTRDMTGEVQQEQKISAIHKAGEELADLTPEELAEMGVEERTDLLKYNIVRHMRDLLGLDFVEIRLLDRTTSRLVPLVAEGMTPLAANRDLYARKEGNGVTGFVAATGQSYLCTDTTNDPLYLEGAAGARSSLTVPLQYHGTVIGTLNVENAQPGAFDERDRQFLEIYARNIAASLNTLELLQAEKQNAAILSVEAISRELALPLDDILSDATTVHRLRHLLYRAREIRGLIQKVGSTIAPESHRATPRPQPRLSDARLLVADSDEAIRRAAHHLLGRQGATVETARDAHEAIALARQSPYSAALVDIRLPDLDGYETFRRLREVQPGVPIILMTGFGYDPTHSIVKARQEGLQTVLYKPFRVDRLMEAVEQALRPKEPGVDGAPSKGKPAAPSAESNHASTSSDRPAQNAAATPPPAPGEGGS